MCLKSRAVNCNYQTRLFVHLGSWTPNALTASQVHSLLGSASVAAPASAPNARPRTGQLGTARRRAPPCWVLALVGAARPHQPHGPHKVREEEQPLPRLLPRPSPPRPSPLPPRSSPTPSPSRPRPAPSPPPLWPTRIGDLPPACALPCPPTLALCLAPLGQALPRSRSPAWTTRPLVPSSQMPWGAASPNATFL